MNNWKNTYLNLVNFSVLCVLVVFLSRKDAKYDEKIKQLLFNYNLNAIPS